MSARVDAARQRLVIFLGGLQSHSLETSSDHALAEDFAMVRRRIAMTHPASRFVYFSYRAGALAEAGLDPLLGWQGRTYDDGSEPVYRAIETTDRPVANHVRGLDWLIRDLTARFPSATIDLIGFSLGGIVALAWAADADDRILASVHRIILVSSPVAGITPLGRLAPKAGIRHALRRYRVDFGRGRVFEDLQASSPVVRCLPRAVPRVDIASVENSRDYLINGHRITGQVILPIWMRTIPLGRGVAASKFLPADQCYVADLGGWDRHLRLTHRQILRGTSPEVRRAHQQIACLVASDGPRWREHRKGEPGTSSQITAPPRMSAAFV